MQIKIDKCLNGIHRIEVCLVKMQKDVEKNTTDLANHIKRTDLLENKLSKIYIVAYIALGVLLAKFGPDVLKILGVL
jgi:hypothetical protein